MCTQIKTHLESRRTSGSLLSLLSSWALKDDRPGKKSARVHTVVADLYGSNLSDVLAHIQQVQEHQEHQHHHPCQERPTETQKPALHHVWSLHCFLRETKRLKKCSKAHKPLQICAIRYVPKHREVQQHLSRQPYQPHPKRNTTTCKKKIH